jgi:formyl-CoA transferase
MVVDLPHDKLGKVPVTGVPIKLSESPGSIDHLGPELGQHNDEIYGGLLGLTASEMDQLRTDGVI